MPSEPQVTKSTIHEQLIEFGSEFPRPKKASHNMVYNALVIGCLGKRQDSLLADKPLALDTENHVPIQIVTGLPGLRYFGARVSRAEINFSLGNARDSPAKSA